MLDNKVKAFAPNGNIVEVPLWMTIPKQLSLADELRAIGILVREVYGKLEMDEPEDSQLYENALRIIAKHGLKKA